MTQQEWHQFTREAGLVAYFRPLTDAKPMGAWNFEISLLQWATAIDDEDGAWNNTFVHPDSVHWLTEGPRLAFPGLTARIGLTDRLDVAVYLTKNPNANYGFWGAQAQYSITPEPKEFATAVRASFVTMYGPDDLNLTVYGVDLLASREFEVYSDRISITPYAGVSTFLSTTREKSEVVALDNEQVLGGQVMVGAVAKLWFTRLGVEYNLAKVSTLSFKVGVSF